jgi:hypothetical protein
LLDFAEPSPLSSSPSICPDGLIIPRSLGRLVRVRRCWALLTDLRENSRVSTCALIPS